MIAIVPRLMNKLYGIVQDDFASQTDISQDRVKTAIHEKLQNLQEKVIMTHETWDATLFDRSKSLIGGKCHTMIIGAAPVSAEILNFMRIALCCTILEAYG